MGTLSEQEVREYTSQPAFRNPAISSRATRRSVPDDIWRSLEMIPGLITWSILIGSVVFSYFAPLYVAYAILIFDVYWLVKSVSMSHGLIRAYRLLKRDMAVDWHGSVTSLGRSIDQHLQRIDGQIADLTGGRRGLPLAAWHLRMSLLDRQGRREYRSLLAERALIARSVDSEADAIPVGEIYHLVVLATYTEELDILRPSFQALVDAQYDHSKMIVVLATEQRDHDRAQANARVLKAEFAEKFHRFIVTEHPSDIVGETKGKGANISWAGRQVIKEIDQLKIPYDRIIVTSLDADHRPHPQYFAAVSYRYALEPDRKHLSFQPTPLFHNNLWYTAAINRVIATGSSFWHMVESTRAYRLRNFAAHSQGLEAVLATDWWSVDTIVEDGQQFWRTYFAFSGRHFVVPIYVPVYQDAVLGETYGKTLSGQYIQLRRWAWGASDFPYIVINAWRDKHIPIGNKITQITRFLEGHIMWAVAPILLTFVGLLPALLSKEFHDSLFGQNFAPTASLILTTALIGIVITIFISLLLLPPKPPGYKARHRVLMLLQWGLMPITTILFSSLPAIESQTRLMFGKYLEFRVTEKAARPLRRGAAKSEQA